MCSLVPLTIRDDVNDILPRVQLLIISDLLLDRIVRQLPENDTQWRICELAQLVHGLRTLPNAHKQTGQQAVSTSEQGRETLHMRVLTSCRPAAFRPWYRKMLWRPDDRSAYSGDRPRQDSNRRQAYGTDQALPRKI